MNVLGSAQLLTISQYEQAPMSGTGFYTHVRQSEALRTHLFPRLQVVLVGIPRHLQADRVVLHLVEVGRARCHGVEEFPPQQLTVQGNRRLAVAPLLKYRKGNQCVGMSLRLPRKPLVTSAMSSATD